LGSAIGLKAFVSLWPLATTFSDRELTSFSKFPINDYDVDDPGLDFDRWTLTVVGAVQKPRGRISTEKETAVKTSFGRFSGILAIMSLAVVSAAAADWQRDVLVLTSTNNANGNEVVVFKLSGASLPFVTMFPTGGNGGASGNAGLQTRFR
jgi:hypothetical protein